jgi:hypothetical protein
MASGLAERFSMNQAGTRGSSDAAGELRRSIIALLRNRSKKARFTTELLASLGRTGVTAEKLEETLADLAAEGVVMIRDHFCADPHLAGVDLRVVALVESIEGADPQMSAIREIDHAWDKWLANYLANHRCG